MSFLEKILNSSALPSPEHALPGRSTAMRLSNQHAVHSRALQPPFPEHYDSIVFAMGYLWGQNGCFGNSLGYGLPQ